MSRTVQRLSPAPALAMVLATVVGTLAGCSDDRADALRDAGATTLFAPRLDGHLPDHWILQPHQRVHLSWKKAGWFHGTLTILERPNAGVCAEHAATYDRCVRVAPDAWRLSFEEQDAVAVVRDGRELLWTDFSLEMPDEDFSSPAEMQAAIDARVQTLVDAATKAKVLTPAEFVDAVPDGGPALPD